VAQLDSASPSEGEGCPFEPGRERISFPLDGAPDVAFMQAALALAGRATGAGDVPVGAVLQVDGRSFAGYNEREARPDPTAHAEMIAIASAARALGRWRIGGTLYVTKEPCAMCAGAIAAARIERLVFGCRDPKGGAAGSVVDILGSAVVNHRVEVTGGVLAEETAAQLRAFFAARRDVERWPSG
jgi:tRNA(adenine34) deaminase